MVMREIEREREIDRWRIAIQHFYQQRDRIEASLQGRQTSSQRLCKKQV